MDNGLALLPHWSPVVLHEPSFQPHGESYDRWKEATTTELQPQRVNEGAMAFMMHISGHMFLTQYALQRTGTLHPKVADFWEGFEGGFIDHIDEVNEDLKAAGLPSLTLGAKPNNFKAAQNISSGLMTKS